MAFDWKSVVMPRWATGGSADVQEPTDAEKDAGLVALTGKVRAAVENWLELTSYEMHRLWRDWHWYSSSDVWLDVDTDASGIAQQQFFALSAAAATDEKRIILGGFVPGGVPLGSISESVDGVTWNQAFSGVNKPIRAVAYDAAASVTNRYIGVGGLTTPTATVADSADGVSWTDRSATAPSVDGPFIAVVADDGTKGWLAITSGRELWSSNDPSTGWTLEDNPLSTTFVDLDNNPTTNRTIAIAAGTASARTATDSATFSNLAFTGVTGFSVQSDSNILFRGGVWVVSGQRTGGSGTRAGFIYSTDDGSTWTAIDADAGWPFLGATGNQPTGSLVGYSEAEDYWLLGEHEVVGGTADTTRLWAVGDLSDSLTASIRPIDLTQIPQRLNSWPAKAAWVNFRQPSREQFFVVPIGAVSERAVLRSGVPIM